MMRHVVLFGLVTLMAGCASGPARPSPVTAPAAVPASASAAPDASGSGPAIAVRVPPRVAMFRLLRRHDNEDPGAGVQLRYAGPDSLIVDVFVYPGPDLAARCPVACAQPYLAAEVRGFEEYIPEMIKRGMVDSLRITRTMPLTPPPGAPWKLGHSLTMAIVQDGRHERSDFELYYLPGYRVKVRATYGESGSRPANVRAFLEALMPALVGAPPPE